MSLLHLGHLSKRRHDQLRHLSTLANTEFAREIRELIKAGAVPATSIGWLNDGHYHGWRQLEKADPNMARLAASMGIQQADDIKYFALHSRRRRPAPGTSLVGPSFGPSPIPQVVERPLALFPLLSCLFRL